MPDKILGLDIGANSLKAVLLVRGFRKGCRVVGARRVAVNGDGGEAEALKTLFSDPAFGGLACITSLPAGELSFRSLRLPFRDDRRIGQALDFALEPLIQTSLDEVFIDYSARGAAAGKAEIFAALAPRDLVARRAEALKDWVREAPVIDIGAVPLAIHLTRHGGGEAVLLLDLGARNSTAIFACRGMIQQVRSFPYGGETAGGLSGERLSADINNTVTSLLWQGVLTEAPAQAFLTGGCSQQPGLAELLGTRLGIPVEKADLARAAGITIDEPLRRAWEPAFMDQALALAARPLSRGKGNGFNFHRLFKATRAGYGTWHGLLKKSAAVAAMLMLLVLVEQGTADVADRLRLAVLKEDLHAAYRQIDPEATRIVEPVAQLKGKIAEARKTSAGIYDAVGRTTVLNLLREIARLAPPDLLVISLNLDGGAFALKGQATHFDSLEVMKKAFAQSDVIQSLTIDGTEQGKEGVTFDLKGVLKR
ncbi:MAG: hypothetical protein FWE89_03140 [Syntrophaceae bacterium]|nr:hypothetical protein [Syntrophaceae bacterium]